MTVSKRSRWGDLYGLYKSTSFTTPITDKKSKFHPSYESLSSASSSKNFTKSIGSKNNPRKLKPINSPSSVHYPLSSTCYSSTSPTSSIDGNYILNALDDFLYDIYSTFATAREIWESLEKKYRTQVACSKKFIVGKFINFKMNDAKPVVKQVEELQIIVHEMEVEGATKYICNSKRMLVSYQKVNEPEPMFMGNGTASKIEGKGNVLLKLTSRKDLGFKLVFESNKFVITKGGVYVGKGYLDEGLFKLSVVTADNVINNNNAGTRTAYVYMIDPSFLWHSRLCWFLRFDDYKTTYEEKKKDETTRT
ncbi:hypothetical protein Tco_0391176 [Tanacetum coccineum]